MTWLLVALIAIALVLALRFLNPSKEQNRWLLVLVLGLIGGVLVGLLGVQRGWFGTEGAVAMVAAFVAGAIFLEIPRSVAGRR
ncbi:MAG: hypothetical protein R3E98_00695 [Gemmatimonadota bacterium]